MSTTTNLSSLVINYLTQAQYDAAAQAGTLDENQIYLTPAVEFTETDPTVPSWAKESSKPSYNFSEIGSTPTTLSGYGITNAYTKTEVDGLVSGVLHYKGTKANSAALPSSGNTTGDVWHVTDTGAEYAWDGSTWQELGTAVDLSGYLQTGDIASWAKASTKPSYALSELTGASDVQAIEALSGTSGLLKKTAADTWTLDTSTYLTSFTETDPVFSASAAAGITSTDISNWNAKVSDDKTWNGVGLNSGSVTSTSLYYVPVKSNATLSGNADWFKTAQTPTAYAISRWDGNSYLYSTTPSANDNSTKVATTAYVDAAIPVHMVELEYYNTIDGVSVYTSGDVSCADIKDFIDNQEIVILFIDSQYYYFTGYDRGVSDLLFVNKQYVSHNSMFPYRVNNTYSNYWASYGVVYLTLADLPIYDGTVV